MFFFNGEVFSKIGTKYSDYSDLSELDNQLEVNLNLPLRLRHKLVDLDTSSYRPTVDRALVP